MEKILKQISNNHNHEVCPREYDSIPNVTGYPGLDAVITRSHNKDMLGRLSLYLAGDAYNSSKMDK